MLLYNWKAYLELTSDRKCYTVGSLLASMNLTFPQIFNFYLWLTEQKNLYSKDHKPILLAVVGV